MGAVWFHSLPDVLRAAGLVVETHPGWEWRSRSTGGYNDIRAIGVHHDAIKTGTPLINRCSAAWDATWNPNRPVGAVWLHTDGVWRVGAAGATNTQGRGVELRTSKGVIPENQGNLYMLSIEASNNGVGEVWPEVQQKSYVAGVTALCKHLKLNPATDIFAHFESAPGRKIDPAGPSRYASGTSSWNMDAFRRDVITAGITPPQNGAVVTTTKSEWQQARVGEATFMGDKLFRVPQAAGKKAVTVSLHVVTPNHNGWVVAFLGPQPPTSSVNYIANQVTSNTVTVPVDANGWFAMHSTGLVRVIVDLVGVHS